jgi:acetyl-CoA carboxylase carboxyl transferase subunit alpha
LRFVQDDSAVDISQEIERLSKKAASSPRRSTASSRLADLEGRAPSAARLHARLRGAICTDFEEMHGDRAFADDTAIVGGLARFNGQSVMVIGPPEGRDTTRRSRATRHAAARGLRKALRLMRLAEKFGIPLLTFVDTRALPGIGAEERPVRGHRPESYVMSGLRVPIVTAVIGEGGSGGALAIAVGDVTLMLQYATTR